MVNVALVAGPSHVARWRWHVRDGVVDSPLAWERFIGRGGAPIWHPPLLSQAADAAGAEGSIAVLVGHFRLGNRILLEDPVPSDALVGGFTGITAGAMTAERDTAMLKRGLAGMRAWHEAFGARASYVLWAAFGRQVHDRLAGRHIADGRYRHPVFNYDDIVTALPGLDIVDLSPLLRLPQHEVSRLFIDASNHPSQVGYLLLNGLIFDRLGAREAYDRAAVTVENELLRLAQKISASAGRSVLITGKSAWLDTLSRYMGANGAVRLAEAGLILAPLDHVPGQPSLAQIVERTDLAKCTAVVVSAGGKDLSAALARAFRTGLSMWSGVPVIDWESATEKAISDRGETPRFARLDSALRTVPEAFTPILRPSTVEQGPLGTPSWLGITTLLQQIAESHWHAPRSNSPTTVLTPPPDPARTAAVNGVRARACYDAAPFLSLKHTTYFTVYDHLFSRFVGKAPVIVEVGVLNGGSMYMWREFFGPDARVIGIDLNPEAVWLREDGFEIHIGDQSDPQFWEDFFRQVGDVDIFLDDGGHTYPQQIVTASSALHHIRDGGLLVVEDTHTSYLKEFGGPSETSFMSWAVNLVHGVNHRFSAFAEDHNPEMRAWSVQFFESIVAFHIDRSLTAVNSQPTTNDGVGRDAKDFRNRSENTLTENDLKAYFRH